VAATPTIQLNGRSDWTLMTAIHDALRRDLDELVHTTVSRPTARWITFRDQLDFHLAAEDTAMWPPARARLTGDRTARSRRTPDLLARRPDRLLRDSRLAGERTSWFLAAARAWAGTETASTGRHGWPSPALKRKRPRRRP
jgi:hypothetical protein